jgi:hypothetical protein
VLSGAIWHRYLELSGTVIWHYPAAISGHMWWCYLALSSITIWRYPAQSGNIQH